MALTVSEEYATGPRTFHILQEGEGKPYRVALAQMSWRMAVVGIGLTFGVFQFIPALRRKATLSGDKRLL